MLEQAAMASKIYSQLIGKCLLCLLCDLKGVKSDPLNAMLTGHEGLCLFAACCTCLRLHAVGACLHPKALP